MGEETKQLYSTIIQVANYFLEKTMFLGLQFDIEQLQEHNPSFEELAKLARFLAKNIHSLAEGESLSVQAVAIDAHQASYFMERLALGITLGDQSIIEEARTQLDKMPFIMYT